MYRTEKQAIMHIGICGTLGHFTERKEGNKGNILLYLKERTKVLLYRKEKSLKYTYLPTKKEKLPL